MKAILDTSILISREPLPAGIDAGISTVSLSELYFGVLKTADPDERIRRAARFGKSSPASKPIQSQQRLSLTKRSS